jgi:DUF4097 and DUF4098 domain-containing protein YvlB
MKNKSMNRPILYTQFILAVLATLFLGAQLLPAEASPDNRIKVPLSDPSRPAHVRAHLVSGSITVKAADTKEIIVEGHVRGRQEGDEDEVKPEGRLHRIPMTSTGLSVEADSDNNDVRISADSTRRAVDLIITVPVHTSLSLHTVNGGNIKVSGVDGELDVNDVNGEVELTNISGSAVAHALNGKVLVTFNRVDAKKPMAFSSLNGAIDVTFPPDIKANLSMRTDNGEVYSDFDIQLQATSAPPTVEDNRGKGGKYVVRIEKTVRGTINGGGQEIQFKNFNGNIYIRKAGGK